MHLSWLAPDISAAIVKGRHPKHLNARKLLRTNGIPLEWDAQRGGVGFQLIGRNAPHFGRSGRRRATPENGHWIPGRRRARSRASITETEQSEAEVQAMIPAMAVDAQHRL